MRPKILDEIVDSLLSSGLTPDTQLAEGRANSLVDERNVIDWLQKQPQFKGRIESSAARKFGDFWVLDYDDTWHVVNIKTTTAKSPDNAYSKIGLLWAFTDLSLDDFRRIKISSKIKDNRFAELILKHKKEVNRDYWFLYLDKNNFDTTIFIRGLKEITSWNKNPTNNIQIKWYEEKRKTPISLPFDQVFTDVIIDGVFRCWYTKSLQWQDAIDYHKEYLTSSPV
jgi:hypothetical protein